MVPDHVNDNARNIRIDLKNRISKHIKLALKFAAKYLLISEVTFETISVPFNYQAKIDDLELIDNLRINKKSSLYSQNLNMNTMKTLESIKNLLAQDKDEASLMKKLNFNELPKKDNLEYFNHNQFKGINKFENSNMILPNETTITLNAILISSVIFVCFCIFLLVSVIFYRKFNKKNDLLANNILKTTLVQNNNKLELIHKLQNVEFGIGDLNKQSLLNLRQPSSLSSHTGTLHKDNRNLLVSSPVTGSSSLINNSNQNNSSNDSSLVRSESNHEYAVPNLSHYEEINQSNYSGFYNKINELEFNQKQINQDQLKQNKLTNKQLTNNFINYQSNGSLNNLTSSLKRNQPINSNNSTFKAPYFNAKSTTMKIGMNNLTNNIKTQYKTNRSMKNQASTIKSLLVNDLKLNLIQPNQIKLMHSFIGQSKFGNIGLAKIRLRDQQLDGNHLLNDLKKNEPNSKQIKQLVLIETVDFQDVNYDYSLEYKQQVLNWLNLIQQLKTKPQSCYEDAKFCLSNNFASLVGILHSELSPFNQIQLVMEYGNCSLATFLKQHSPETIE